MRPAPPGKAKDGEVEKLSRSSKRDSEAENWRWGGREGREQWSEAAMRLEVKRKSRAGLGAYLGMGNFLTSGEDGVEVKVGGGE